MKILFVCRGNVGRSQIAKAIYDSIFQGDADSAGTKASRSGTKLKDFDGAKNIITVGKEIGFDLSNESPKQLTEGMIDNFDRVVVMAEPETIPDYLRNSSKFIYWQIEDPKGKDLEFARSTRDKIKQRIIQAIDNNFQV